MPMYKYNKCLENRGLKGKMKTLKIVLFSVLFILLTVALISSASAISDSKTEKIIFITLNYNNNALSVKDIASGNGFIPQFVDSNFEQSIGLEKADLEIFSVKNELLYQSNFYVDNKKFQDVLDGNGELSGGLAELNNIDFVVTAPYFDEMERIEIHSDYNDIVLSHVKNKFDVAKTIKVPTFKSDEKASEKKVKEKEEDKPENETQEYAGLNGEADSTSPTEEGKIIEIAADENSEQKKSFVLELIEIVNSIYYYIFG